MLSQYMANKCKSTRSTYFNGLGLRLSHGLMLNSVEIITPHTLPPTPNWSPYIFYASSKSKIRS